MHCWVRRRGEYQESVYFTQGEVYMKLIYIQLRHTMEKVKLSEKLKVTANHV